jgi:hypothetical protein
MENNLPQDILSVVIDAGTYGIAFIYHNGVANYPPTDLVVYLDTKDELAVTIEKEITGYIAQGVYGHPLPKVYMGLIDITHPNLKHIIEDGNRRLLRSPRAGGV